MAHNSLPHNLTEVCNAIIAYIQKGGLTVDEVLEYIKGPDFPLENVIINSKDIRSAFLTGKSSVSLKIRGIYNIKGQDIIFTTIPYRTYRNKIKEQINKNIDELAEYIDDFDDESGLGANKLIFHVKNNISPEKAVLKLFALTDLQTTVSYNMNYIVNGTPKLCSMMELIEAYILHQTDVLINSTLFDKEKAENRKHILEGLIIAVEGIDKAIELIRGSLDSKEAISKLIAYFHITEIQAKAILDMKLAKLTKLDKDDLLKELEEKKIIIAECNKILTDETYRNSKLIELVTELKNKYGDARRTQLLNIEVPKEEKEIAEVIPEDVVVVITESGLIKRVPIASYRTQKRNGVGIKNSDDITKYLVKTNTIDTLMVFSSKGKMYRLLVDKIPAGTNASKGTPISALINFDTDEYPMAYSSLYRDTTANFVFFVTKNGIIKKSPLTEYSKTKKSNGIVALTLREGDALAAVTFIEQEEMLLVSKNGMVIRIATDSIPISSRTAQGVKGMNLNAGDAVLTCLPIKHTSDNLAVISTTGMGKQSSLTEFTTQGRGGKGVICYKGELAGAALIDESDDLLIVGDKTSIRLSAKELPNLGRVGLGNVIIKNNKQILNISKI